MEKHALRLCLPFGQISHGKTFDILPLILPNFETKCIFLVLFVISLLVVCNSLLQCLMLFT